MTTDLSLEALAQGLREPFALADIKFLPKSPTNENGAWKCLALPYADKRVYEDRLNDLAFGHWSTPPNAPFTAGNKLVIPVTVVLCGVAHTDYGEAFLASQSRKGELREEENSATEAYSQGFRRACAQFRLGRYLYNLPKFWVPYDPMRREIALTGEDKRLLAERLYRQAGLLPAQAATQAQSQAASAPAPVQGQHAQAASTVPGEACTEDRATDAQMQRIRQLCDALRKVPPAQSSLSVQAANNLLERLTRVYNQRKAAQQTQAV
jgi:hypothetical protein